MGVIRNKNFHLDGDYEEISRGGLFSSVLNGNSFSEYRKKDYCEREKCFKCNGPLHLKYCNYYVSCAMCGFIQFHIYNREYNSSGKLIQPVKADCITYEELVEYKGYLF